MSYVVLSGFPKGLDPRKFSLGAPAGTLVECNNGHISNAGDLEKRKGFPSHNNTAILDSLGDTGIFWLQETATGLTVFGSAYLFGATPTLGQPTLASAITVTNPVVTYQKLTHPAVLEGTTYDRNLHRMIKLIASELFGGTIQAVAQFNDGRVFGYSTGVFVEDYASGLVLPHLANDNPKLTAHIKRITNLSDDYDATTPTVATVSRARASNVATLITATHNLATGMVVTVAGLSGTGYNASNVIITVTSPTSFTYANTGSNEGVTADIGGTVTLLQELLITGPLGVDYTIDTSKQTISGTITGPTLVTSPVAARAGISAAGSFRITGGSQSLSANAAATGTITRNATNASNGDFYIIGTKRYTFRTTIAVEGDVLVKGTALLSQQALADAINHAGTPNTDYKCFQRHPVVTAGAIAGNDLPLTARKGINPALSTTNVPGWTVSAATMTGGTGNCVSMVSVVSTTGASVALLSDAVTFTTDQTVTAAAVSAAINAFTGTSGYTSDVDGDKVLIFSSTSASPMPNSYNLEIVAGGNVCIGLTSFFVVPLVTTSTPWNLTIQVNGFTIANLKPFPDTAIDTLPEYYAGLETTINSTSGTSGTIAFARTDLVQLSRQVTRSDDTELPVYVTPDVNAHVGVTFGTPPSATVPLTVTVPEHLFEAGAAAHTMDGTTVAVATVTGGSGIYNSFSWEVESVGSNQTTTSSGVLLTTFASTSNLQATLFQMTRGGQFSLLIPAGTYVFRFVCKVIDSFGGQATSNTLTLHFLVA